MLTLTPVQDKDTSKYHLSLGQALDSIRGRIGYIAVSGLGFCRAAATDERAEIDGGPVWVAEREEGVKRD